MSTTEAENTTDTRILVRSVYANLAPSWSEWADTDVDAVIEKVGEKVLDGKGTSLGMEIIEVTVTRRVVVKAKVEALDVTEEPTR